MPCLLAKFDKPSHNKARNKYNVGTVSTDIFHFNVQSAKHTCCQVFIHHDSGCVYVYPMKKKSDAPRALTSFLQDISKDSTSKIKCLRSDGAKEFQSTEFTGILGRHTIGQEIGLRHDHQSNGNAERCIRNIAKITRAILIDSGFS